jgi:hypothetical protein
MGRPDEGDIEAARPLAAAVLGEVEKKEGSVWARMGEGLVGE